MRKIFKKTIVSVMAAVMLMGNFAAVPYAPFSEVVKAAADIDISTLSFTINGEVKQVKNSNIDLGSLCTYDGNKHKIAPEDIVISKADGTVLEHMEDYYITYPKADYTSADNYSIDIDTIFDSGYDGQVYISYDIDAKDITDIAKDISFTYKDGSSLDVASTVSLGGKVLTKDTDYELSYVYTGQNAGTSLSYTVSGKGNYKGEVTGSAKINPASIENCTVEGITYDYTGSVITPNIVVKNGNITLVKDTDYTMGMNPTTVKEPGNYILSFAGHGNYTGNKIATLIVGDKDITNCTASIDGTYTYTGSKIEPVVTVKNGAGETLTKDTDYTVAYENNVNAGTAKAVITGTGIYEGEITKEFTIACADASDVTVAKATKTFTYNNKNVSFSNASGNLSLTFGGKTLIYGQDYTVSSGAKAVGTHTETIQLCGNFTGRKTFDYVINPARKVKFSTSAYGTIKLDNTRIKVTWNGTYNSVSGDGAYTGIQFIYADNASFKNYSSKNWTYSSSASRSLSLYPEMNNKKWYVKARVYKKVGNKYYYGRWNTAKEIKVGSKSLTVANTGINQKKISWTTLGSANKYQVYQSVNGAKYEKISTTANKYYTFTPTAENTYRFRVRGYKTTNGTTVYTAYTKVYTLNSTATAGTLTKEVAESANNITLNWVQKDCDGYYIYRKTYSNSWSNWSKYATIKDASVTSYTNYGLSDGKSYTYCVKAYNSAYNNIIEFARTNDVSHTLVQNNPVPVESTANKATPDTISGTVTVKWEAVTCTGYKVTIKGSDGTTRTDTTTTASYEDKGVTAGVTYTYAVVPYTKNVETGSITLSPAGSTEVGSATAPNAVRAFTSLKIDNAKTEKYVSPTFSWNAITGAAKYVVYRSTSKTSGFKEVKTTTALSYKDTTLQALKVSATYYYLVKAFDSNGNRICSSTSNLKSTKFTYYDYVDEYTYQKNGRYYYNWDRVFKAAGAEAEKQINESAYWKSQNVTLTMEYNNTEFYGQYFGETELEGFTKEYKDNMFSGKKMVEFITGDIVVKINGTENAATGNQKGNCNYYFYVYFDGYINHTDYIERAIRFSYDIR